MQLYEIALPLRSNKGMTYAGQLAAWRVHALMLAGGYTEMPLAQGTWIDATGQSYSENMQCYRVATNDADAWDALVESAFRLFPDQVAIWHARIGQATIERRDIPRVTKGGLHAVA